MQSHGSSMKTFFLLLLSLFIHTSAVASWVSVASDDRSDVFFEADRMVRNGSVATVWTLTNYRVPQLADGVSFLSSKSRNQFNCVNETRQQLATVRYSLQDGKGESVYSEDRPTEARAIVPDSLADGMMKLVCARRGTTAKSPWIKFSENERLTSYYEQPVARQPGSVSVWVLFDYKAEQESPRSGRRYVSEKGQHEIDCQGGKTRTVFATWHEGHMANGKVVYTGSSPMQWEPNSPGGIGQALANVLCAKN